MSRGVARAVAVLVVAGAILGCEDRRAAERRAEEAVESARSRPRTGEGPEALMIWFQEASGTGLGRRSWEMEVLKLGSDVRLRGSRREGLASTPIGGMLSHEEWAELWTQIVSYPLENFRAVEDSSEAEPGWTKRLEVDMVVGERRIRSRQSWRRPLRDAAWVEELEQSLLAIATEHEVTGDAPAADSTKDAVDRALRDTMRELDAPLLPDDEGGSP